MNGAVATAIPPQTRLVFVDNLRWVMILLVVSMHAAVTYSHLGSWYFMEEPPPDLVWKVLFAAYQMFLQAFFMGLLFLLAGYFVPGAFARKGFARFARDRAVRLGVPSVLYMLVIQPVTIHWLLRHFAEPNRPSLARAYWPYLSSGRVLGGSGPMWFTLALLGFSLVYGLCRLATGEASSAKIDPALPSHRQVFGLAAVMGACTFLARIVQPIGTSILNMQLCFFSQYVLLFAIGILAWQRDWLMRIPYHFGVRWLFWALPLGSLVWLAIILWSVSTHTESALVGGLNWQSAALSLWESFFCVGFCLGLVVVFRDKFNRQGPLARWLSDNCFAVYLFHPPLLIAVTLALRGVEAPKPIKFLLASLLGAAVTYLASSLVLRRIPLLKRVL